MVEVGRLVVLEELPGSLEIFGERRMLEDDFSLPSMTVINPCPEMTDEIQQKYGGQQGAVVDRKFVAFGYDSVEAMENAKQKGFSQDEVMLVGIPRLGAIYA